MNKKSALDIIILCLDDLYRNSEPTITWKEINQVYSETKINYFQNHLISKKKFNEIKSKYKKLLPKLYHYEFELRIKEFSPTIKN